MQPWFLPGVKTVSHRSLDLASRGAFTCIPLSRTPPTKSSLRREVRTVGRRRQNVWTPGFFLAREPSARHQERSFKRRSSCCDVQLYPPQRPPKPSTTGIKSIVACAPHVRSCRRSARRWPWLRRSPCVLLFCFDDDAATRVCVARTAAMCGFLPPKVAS